MRTKVLPAYLSYAQRVDDAQNRLIRSYWNTYEKIVQSGAAILNSISVEAGVGTGLGGSVSVGIVSVSSQYKNDYVNYSGNIGNTKLGNVQQLSLELSLGFPGVDELSKSVSITGTYYHPFNAANCTCDGAWNYLASCPAVEYTYSENDTLSLGASVYLGVGGTIQVSIDSANMWNELRTIWN